MSNDEIFELVQSYLSGDDYSFTTLYNMTKNKVFANIYSYIRNDVISEDLLADTYVNFLSMANSIKREQSILGLLYVISRNLSLNYIKKHKKEELIDEHASLPTREEKIKSSLDYEDTIVVMKKVLSEVQFKVVIMRIVGEMEYSEISSLLKKKESTVRWIYAEGIKKVKEAIYVR